MGELAAEIAASFLSTESGIPQARHSKIMPLTSGRGSKK